MWRRDHRRSKSKFVRLQLEALENRFAPAVLLGQQPGAPDTTQFHGDAARTGFYQNETFLTPTNVASSFGQVWQSPVLDGHLYASPLYQDNILIQGNGNAAHHAGDGVQSPSFQGKTLGVVFAATGGGTVYAIAAQDTDGPTGIAPGTILWKTHLGNPYGGIDGNSIGVLSTPIIDLQSGRIYVTASVTDYLLPSSDPNHGRNNWEVFALNLSDGSLVSGWPLAFTQSLLDSLNQNTLNGPNAVPFSPIGADQRGALALSPDGSTLYVDFACYGSSNPGWMTTVATGVSNGVANGQTPAIVSAYSGTDSTAINANAGMWGAGGPVVDANGNVFVSTGDSPNGTGQTLGAWGNSVLEWAPGQTLRLIGVYTPWNYQTQDTIDSDLGGGSPILINLPAGSSTTTELLASGGKQGNAYLLDAGNKLNNPTPNPNNSPASYPADLTKRPPPVNPDQDPSLYDPNAIRSYFNPPQTGPLALFQPYNETSASGNTAKARDTPATFIGPDGTSYVMWAGSSKAGVGSSIPVAPSLYLTQVVASPGQPAYLQIVAQNTQVMSLPGANIITANGTADPIDWIVDAGVQRLDNLTSFANGAPTLYAYDALTLQPLWSSSYEQLDLGGKYGTLAAARGDVFVGTDRIQAFGLTNDTIVDDSVQGMGRNQFNYVGSGWTHNATTATMGTFDGTVSTDNVAGDYATLTFTGSQIKVYANEARGYGSVTVSVDGGNAQTLSLNNTTNSPNGQGEGDVLIYTLAGLGAGTHTLKFLNNGSATVALDRVAITPPVSSSSALGVSLTEGNVTPVAGHVLSYTINYNNAGSIVGGSGTNATGVVLTETVPANTTADLADSTPGWTLTSGTGGAGSTYTFTVGALNAGVTGSVVFSVNVNSTIPSGTTSLTNTVTITDAASDSSSGTRVSPLVATSLVFSQQPANGETGVALPHAVTVAEQDQLGNRFTGDSSSTVTLTLNGGTFVGGGNTVTATVSNGVAIFNNLAIAAAGSYTLTATDGSLTSATSNSFLIQTPTQLVFTQQPGNVLVGTALRPPVAVTVEDANGASVTGDSSTVTLTLSSGTFANGSNTVTANAINGVATFSNLVINSAGTYTLTATDGNLTGATSNPFAIVTSVYDDFNSAATDFTSNFTVYNNGGANNTSLTWGAAFGVDDQPGSTAGGGVESSGGVAIDSTAVYTPSQVNLSDGKVHTLSEYVTAVSGLNSGNTSLQLGYLTPNSTGFNAGFSFISARILGNHTVELQYDNGTPFPISLDNTTPTGPINPGDWLDLIFTTQETASGSFRGTFSLIDYGPTGVGAGTTVLAPVSYTVSGLTSLGTASAVSSGFRTQLPASLAGPVQFDNFAIQSPAIINSTPTGNGFNPVSSIRVTFNEPVDPTTFSTATITSFTRTVGSTVTDLTGSLIAVTPVAGSNNTQFDITFATQNDLGAYSLVIAPGILDQDGNPTMTSYADNFAIQGPQIIAGTPTGNANLPSASRTVRVTFNEPINPATFTSDEIFARGPAGPIAVSAINPVAGSNNTQFDLLFPQTVTGTYTLLIGPDIQDQAGHKMDQDGDFIGGELPDDLYALQFGVQGLQVASAIPNSTIPGQAYSVHLAFNEAVDVSSFDAGEVTLSGPDGDHPAIGVVPTNAAFTTFDVLFAPLTAAGTYQLTVGPNIADVYGNLMDQDGNLVPGESTDAYTTTFTLAAPRVTATLPSGTVTQPVDHVRLTFDRPMDPSTFSTDSFALTGPDGSPIAITGVTAVPFTNNTQFDVSFDTQGANGSYALTVSPGTIADQYGNLLSSPFTASFTITGGPQVSSFSPTGNVSGPIDHVRVTFDRPIDASTFTPDQVSTFIGPDGNPIPINSVVEVAGTNHTQFDVTFDPQSAPGTYTLTLSSGITDLFGNPLTGATSQLVTNGGFETGDFSGWTQSGDTSSTSVISGPPDGSTIHSGTNAAEFGPSGLGFLTQILATTPGITYTLDFWLSHPFSGDTGTEWLVQVGGNTLMDVHNAGNFDYTEFRFTFTATSSSTALRFGFMEPPAFFYLDDVSVTPTSGSLTDQFTIT